jgi:predicted DNA-binding transcriptional regulator YafY
MAAVKASERSMRLTLRLMRLWRRFEGSHGRPIRLQSLAEEHRVTERTIRRDLLIFEAVGWSIERNAVRDHERATIRMRQVRDL